MSCCMICATCACGCHILPENCISDINYRAKRFKVWEKPELENAVNTFILIGKANDGLLGQSCFDSLCAAIKQADKDAQDYRNSLNGDYAENDPLAEFWHYLPANWNAVLSNYHFKNMYAAYLVYYYYKLGYADAETTLSGEIKHKIQATSTDGMAGENISLNDAKSKANEAGSIAKSYYDAFVNNFWNANKAGYNCTPHENKCEKVCEVKKDCDNIAANSYKRKTKFIHTRGI